MKSTTAFFSSLWLSSQLNPTPLHLILRHLLIPLVRTLLTYRFPRPLPHTEEIIQHDRRSNIEEDIYKPKPVISPAGRVGNIHR